MNKQLTAEEVTASYQSIIRANLPTANRTVTRQSHDRKAWAAAVRAMLRNLGIKAVSVTAPSYSQAHSIDIRLPRYAEAAHTCFDSYTTKYAPIDERHCRACTLQSQAQSKMHAIMHVGFPQLDNRSDSQTDYFDFCWTVN